MGGFLNERIRELKDFYMEVRCTTLFLGSFFHSVVSNTGLMLMMAIRTKTLLTLKVIRMLITMIP